MTKTNHLSGQRQHIRQVHRGKLLRGEGRSSYGASTLIRASTSDCATAARLTRAGVPAFGSIRVTLSIV
ncbi:hypothetical protein KCP69_09210 [Salmonella enterica subsp. enterica]|nr:hypothetical protein KCP69_09210 [Salmonella enterica subsp. enterica]